MKKTLLLAFIALPFFTRAQSVSPEVLTTSGDYFTSAGAQLSWTLGEPVIETVSGTNATLTQGFQQTWQTGTIVNEINPSQMQITVFPNPTQGQITFSFKQTSGRNFMISYFDIAGKLIRTEQVNYSGTQIQSDISSVTPGMYLIVISDENLNQQSFQLIKQ